MERFTRAHAHITRVHPQRHHEHQDNDYQTNFRSLVISTECQNLMLLKAAEAGVRYYKTLLTDFREELVCDPCCSIDFRLGASKTH